LDISVIIPTHNRAETLPRALDSVLAQSFAATEIIVVDDASSDDTQTLISKHYPQARYLRLPENLGVSAARNRGIALARGQWIALLDSDDAWLEGKLAAQKSALESAPAHRLCHTEEIWIRNGKRVNAMHKHAKSGGYIFQRCLPLCVISPSSVLLHRSVFSDFGVFDEQLPACEDYDLWLRICASEPALFVPTAQIIKHGGHADQLSRRFWGMDRFRIQALEKILQSAVLDRQQRQAASAMLVEKARIFAQGAEKRGHQARAEHYRRLANRYVESTAALD
jgi:glycosyltransferase involved in cell wall biosynthesis